MAGIVCLCMSLVVDGFTPRVNERYEGVEFPSIPLIEGNGHNGNFFPMAVLGNIMRGIAACLCASLLVSCLDGDPLSGRRSDMCEDGCVPVRLVLGGVADTKRSMLSGIEEAGSGALLLAYQSSDGVLAGVVYYSQEDLVRGSAKELSLNYGREYDFYVVGNLNYINTEDGRVADIWTALGAGFPARVEDLVGFVYYLDGGRLLNTVWRREKASDVRDLGIPYRGEVHSLSTEAIVSEGMLCVNCRYLFSRLHIVVAHEGLDGGEESGREWFRNVSLSVRQANARLLPFSSAPMKALSAGDVIGGADAGVEDCFDYDVSMNDSTLVEYVVYVPENVQGVLLPYNMSSVSKTPQALEEDGKGYLSKLCTYVEFVGSVSSQASGFDGCVSYRFYPGEDAETDFSLVGGKRYDISLGFKAGNIFGTSWKVDAELTDHRVLELYRDEARTRRLGVGEVVMLYPGVSSSVYFRIDDGQGHDVRTRRSDMYVRRLDECFVQLDFMWQGSQARLALEDAGVGVTYDVEKGEVSFFVDDVESYVMHGGESFLLPVSLVPGEGVAAAVIELAVPSLSRHDLHGYSFEVLPVYKGDVSVLRYWRAPDGEEGASLKVYVDDELVLSSFVLDDEGFFSLGVLPRGVHTVMLTVMTDDGLEGGGLMAEVCDVPVLDVDYGLQDMRRYYWRRLRDAEGKAYVAHNRGDGYCWVEMIPSGRFDSVSYSYSGACGRVVESDGSSFVMEPSSRGVSNFQGTFRLGKSVRVVSVPYVVYDSVMMQGKEWHGALVLVNNNIRLGWTTLADFSSTVIYGCSVEWRLSLSLKYVDGTSESGNWGPFKDEAVVLGDGTEYLRSFRDEFKELRHSFFSGHDIDDAQYLDGKVYFKVSTPSPYVLAVPMGMSISEINGMVSARVETLSADSRLRHFEAHSSEYYVTR